MFQTIGRLLLVAAGALLMPSPVLSGADGPASGDDPPVIDPFGRGPPAREDAIPGYVELSDGAVHPGRIHLTRDKRLKIFDEKLKRQREIPLSAVEQIECRVTRQWMEKQWKFRRPASSEKVFTGRTYPVREYLHTITLRDGRTITGPLSAIVYVRPPVPVPPKPGAYGTRAKPRRYMLHKRDKGKIGKELKSLVYVKLIRLGDEALAEGREEAARRRRRSAKPKKRDSAERPETH